jgi:hypothetical protein
VRKSSRAREHCRIRRSVSQKEKGASPTKRPSTSEAKPKEKQASKTYPTNPYLPKHNARIAAGKAKLWQVARELSPQKCSDFSLMQRGKTCFMSAATLLVGRTMMPYIKDDAVRRYVRYSMANAWEDAQGPVDDGSCPRIPKRVRQYYAALWDTTYMVPQFRTVKIEAHEMKCVANDTCVSKHLDKGGFLAQFITALLWGSDLPCTYTQRMMHWHDHTWEKTSITRQLMYDVLIQHVDASVPFHVVTFPSYNKTGMRIDGVFDRLLFRVLDNFY